HMHTVPSAKGNFISVNAKITVENATQIRAIYAALKASPHVRVIFQLGDVEPRRSAHNNAMTEQTLYLRFLQEAPYKDSWQAMRTFTQQRDRRTPDELWVLEHPPVYTLGQAGLEAHILQANNIPVVQCDRGG